MTVLATGEQFLLRCAGAEAVVVEVGGGLRSYRAGGRDVVDGFAEREMAPNARGQVLAPWPNRLDDGRYSWDGEEHVTPVTEPETGNAIHGLVRFAPWQVVDRAATPCGWSTCCTRSRATRSRCGCRWPTSCRRTGCGCRPRRPTRATSRLPYGEGHHPYLAAGAGLLVDDCTLTAPGATRLDHRRAAAADRLGAGRRHPYDLRAGRVVGDLLIDHCFTDLERDADGLAWVRLTGPDGRGSELWLDGAYSHLQLFTADVVAPARRRRGLAVEPMTCPPNALATGESVIRLEPGESATGSWGITPLG